MKVSLRRKTFYTSLTKILNICLNFALQFLITPFILNGLGKQLFGIFTLINKIQGYLSMVDLRPTAILRFKLASLQTSKNFIDKREYVGASIILSLFILPFMVLLGWLLSLEFHNIFEIDEIYIEIGKKAIIIISAFVGIKGLLGVPEAIIRGNNLEYKAFFIEPIRLIIYSSLVYLFLSFGFGLIGVIFAIIFAAILDFSIKLLLQIKYLPGFSPLYPSRIKLKEFLGNGSWYMGSSLFSQVLSTSDVIIIGIVFGVNEVTIYALSKAMLFRFSESLADVIGSMTASVGHLISNNRNEDIINLREKLFRSSLIFGTLIMSYFILFNKSFVTLWVGESNFIGNYASILLVFASLYQMLCLIDEIFINSLQIFYIKTKILFITTSLYIILTLFLSYEIGLIAIPLCLAFAKCFQWIYYQLVLQKYYQFDLLQNIMKNYRLIIILISVLLLNYIVEGFEIFDWYSFLGYSMLFVFVIAGIFFSFILKKEEVRFFINFTKKIFNG